MLHHCYYFVIIHPADRIMGVKTESPAKGQHIHVVFKTTLSPHFPLNLRIIFFFFLSHVSCSHFINVIGGGLMSRWLHGGLLEAGAPGRLWMSEQSLDEGGTLGSTFTLPALVRNYGSKSQYFHPLSTNICCRLTNDRPGSLKITKN